MTIWLVEEIQISTKTFNTREDTLNGSMSTMDTLEQSLRLKFMLNGHLQMTHLHMIMLDTI